METFRLDLDSCEVLVGNLDPGFVFLPTQFGFDPEAGLGCCAPNEIYNDLMADERPPTPILGDERE